MIANYNELGGPGWREGAASRVWPGTAWCRGRRGGEGRSGTCAPKPPVKPRGKLLMPLASLSLRASEGGVLAGEHWVCRPQSGGKRSPGSLSPRKGVSRGDLAPSFSSILRSGPAWPLPPPGRQRHQDKDTQRKEGQSRASPLPRSLPAGGRGGAGFLILADGAPTWGTVWK